MNELGMFMRPLGVVTDCLRTWSCIFVGFSCIRNRIADNIFLSGSECGLGREAASGGWSRIVFAVGLASLIVFEFVLTSQNAF